MTEMLSPEGTEWWFDTSRQWVAHASIQGEDVHFGPFPMFAALVAWVDANLKVGVRCYELNAPDSDPQTWVPRPE